MIDDKCRQTLKRVGKTLLIVGTADFLRFLACLLTEIRTPATFGPLLILAGAFLYQERIRVVGVINMFARLFVAGVPFGLVATLIDQPLGLTGTMLRLHPSYWAIALLLAVALFVTSLWTSIELSRDEVIRTCKSNNVRIIPSVPLFGFIVAIVVGLEFLATLTGEGRYQEQAKRLAAQQVPGHEYHVNALKISKTTAGTTIQARVTAWNDAEIRELSLGWREK
jgi:hypothetical protein